MKDLLTLLAGMLLFWAALLSGFLFWVVVPLEPTVLDFEAEGGVA